MEWASWNLQRGKPDRHSLCQTYEVTLTDWSRLPACQFTGLPACPRWCQTEKPCNLGKKVSDFSVKKKKKIENIKLFWNDCEGFFEYNQTRYEPCFTFAGCNFTKQDVVKRVEIWRDLEKVLFFLKSESIYETLSEPFLWPTSYRNYLYLFIFNEHQNNSSKFCLFQSDNVLGLASFPCSSPDFSDWQAEYESQGFDLLKMAVQKKKINFKKWAILLISHFPSADSEKYIWKGPFQGNKNIIKSQNKPDRTEKKITLSFYRKKDCEHLVLEGVQVAKIIGGIFSLLSRVKNNTVCNLLKLMA